MEEKVEGKKLEYSFELHRDSFGSGLVKMGVNKPGKPFAYQISPTISSQIDCDILLIRIMR